MVMLQMSACECRARNDHRVFFFFLALACQQLCCSPAGVVGKSLGRKRAVQPQIPLCKKDVCIGTDVSVHLVSQGEQSGA